MNPSARLPNIIIPRKRGPSGKTKKPTQADGYLPNATIYSGFTHFSPSQPLFSAPGSCPGSHKAFTTQLRSVGSGIVFQTCLGSWCPWPLEGSWGARPLGGCTLLSTRSQGCTASSWLITLVNLHHLADNDVRVAGFSTGKGPLLFQAPLWK